MSYVKISQSYLEFLIRWHALLWFFTWRHINLFWKPLGYLCPLLREYFCCTRLKLTLHSVFVWFVWMYLSVFVFSIRLLATSCNTNNQIWYMIYQTYIWHMLYVAYLHFLCDSLPIKNWSNYIFSISYQVNLTISNLLFSFILYFVSFHPSI